MHTCSRHTQTHTYIKQTQASWLTVGPPGHTYLSLSYRPHSSHTWSLTADDVCQMYRFPNDTCLILCLLTRALQPVLIMRETHSAGSSVLKHETKHNVWRISRKDCIYEVSLTLTSGINKAFLICYANILCRVAQLHFIPSYFALT